MKYTLVKIINTTELLTNKIININKKASTLLTNAQYDEIMQRMTNIQNSFAPQQSQKIGFGNVTRYARLYYKNEFLMVFWQSFKQCHIGKIFTGVTYKDDDPTTGTFLQYQQQKEVNLKKYIISLSNSSTIKVITSGSVQTSTPDSQSLTIKIFNGDTNQLLATPKIDGDTFQCLPNTNYIIQFIAQ